MGEQVYRFWAAELKEFAARLLEAAGAPREYARLTADSLVEANLRGVDSHGVQLLTFYLERIGRGEVDPRAAGRVVRESGACLLYDGENGLGQVVSEICCGHAVRLARRHGVSLAVARNSNHFGAAAYWALRISSAGLIGIVVCNATGQVPPWQGREGRLGTNPICMSVPGAGGRPWLLDMATTAVAAGKIYKAYFAGDPEIPAGWALDADGRPTTDTKAAYHGLLMPLGGYKGSGLAMMVEILSGVLGGGAMGSEVGGVRTVGRPARNSQTFLGIDVERFMPLEEFRERMRRLVADVKSARPAAGYEEVLVAGEPEWRAEEERRRDGIPIDAGVWGKLLEWGTRLGIEPPQTPPAAGMGA